MSELFLPTSELAANAWLAAIPGLPPEEFIGQELEGDTSLWSETGFVQAQIAGGAPHLELAQGEPVFQINCWVSQPDSQEIPWGQARHLSALITAACLDRDRFGPVTTPAQYQDARVMEAHVLTEPRRVTDDPQRIGGYQLDLQMFWVVAG
jgi:hypothetical protein